MSLHKFKKEFTDFYERVTQKTIFSKKQLWGLVLIILVVQLVGTVLVVYYLNISTRITQAKQDSLEASLQKVHSDLSKINTQLWYNNRSSSSSSYNR